MSKGESGVREIADRLKATRGALGLTPIEFARAAGISIAAYSNWENARGRPGLTQAIRLATVHGLTLDWLYLGDASGLPLRITTRLDVRSRGKTA